MSSSEEYPRVRAYATSMLVEVAVMVTVGQALRYSIRIINVIIDEERSFESGEKLPTNIEVWNIWDTGTRECPRVPRVLATPSLAIPSYLVLGRNTFQDPFRSSKKLKILRLKEK